MRRRRRSYGRSRRRRTYRPMRKRRMYRRKYYVAGQRY